MPSSSALSPTPTTTNLRVAVTLALTAVSTGALAHQSSVIYVDLVVDGPNITARLKVADSDLAPILGRTDERRAGRDEAERGGVAGTAYLADRIRLTGDGRACPAGPAEPLGFAERADGFFAVFTLRYRCPRTPSVLRVRYDLFFDIDPRHEGLATITLPGSAPVEHLFRADRRELDATRPVALYEHLRDYLRLGIEHIFSGYDHLSFLLALLLVIPVGAAGVSVRRGLGDVVRVVSAFTLAHSLTLILAGLDVVRLPSRLVEPAIAASILFVAVENLVRPPRHRFLLTFAFGLVHGFGFASILREVGLPPRGVLPSLLSFNLGVELGQLAVVALVAPMLTVLRHPARWWTPVVLLVGGVGMMALLSTVGIDVTSVTVVFVLGLGPFFLLDGTQLWGYQRFVRAGVSVLLALLSGLWLVERLAERSWLGGVLG